MGQRRRTGRHCCARVLRACEALSESYLIRDQPLGIIACSSPDFLCEVRRGGTGIARAAETMVIPACR